MKQIKLKKSSLKSDDMRICFPEKGKELICNTAPKNKINNSRKAKSLKEILFIAAVSIGIIMAPFVIIFTEGIALAHLIFLIASIFRATDIVEKIVCLSFKLLIGAGIVQSLFVGIFLIMGATGRKDRFCKVWKKMVVPWAIIVFLIISFMAGRILGEIP